MEEKFKLSARKKHGVPGSKANIENIQVHVAGNQKV